MPLIVQLLIALQLVDIEISRKRVKARFFASSSSLLTQQNG